MPQRGTFGRAGGMVRRPCHNEKSSRPRTRCRIEFCRVGRMVRSTGGPPTMNMGLSRRSRDSTNPTPEGRPMTRIAPLPAAFFLFALTLTGNADEPKGEKTAFVVHDGQFE